MPGSLMLLDHWWLVCVLMDQLEGFGTHAQDMSTREPGEKPPPASPELSASGRGQQQQRFLEGWLQKHSGSGLGARITIFAEVGTGRKEQIPGRVQVANSSCALFTFTFFEERRKALHVHETPHSPPATAMMWGFILFLFWGCSSAQIRVLTGLSSRTNDVNECFKTTSCPAYATCTNTVGSYFCTCKGGFRPSNGQYHFNSPTVGCEDINECVENPAHCGPHAVCTNLVGRYRCSCDPGFSSPTGNGWTPGNPGTFACADTVCLASRVFPKHAHCANAMSSHRIARLALLPVALLGKVQHDVDECSQDPALCGPNSVCANTLGSYRCSCQAGFRAHPGGSLAPGNFSCKRIPLKCREDMISDNEQVQRCHARTAAKPPNVSFCALVNATFDILDEACEVNKTSMLSLKNQVESFGLVLQQSSEWRKLSQSEAAALASVLLSSVESTTLAALQLPSANASQTIQTEHLDLESRVIREECNKANVSIQLKAKGDRIEIGCSNIEESGASGVAFVSFAHMESVLDASFFHDPSGRTLRMGSRVVGAVATWEKKAGFTDAVAYTLENVQPKQKSERPICVSWSTDMEEGRWMPAGCVILEASELHTVCSCRQMANLAVIMASGDLTRDFSLHIISHVGTAISLLCLILAIATFLLCRTLRNRNTYLHLHLCVCLFLAKTLFLIGIDKTNHQMGCAIIAGLLHYLFLAAFSWMLVEAAMLFLTVRNLKVVNYFSSRDVQMLHLCAFGYGFPGLVVAVSASVQPQGYGMHDRCWLNTETGFIWSFLGPVCVIIAINSVLLSVTLWILKQKLASVNAEVSTLKDTRLLTFKAFAQIFILGCSWLLGVFQLGPVARVMAYLFTITNSLQGAFVFLIHCVLNHQVREEYQRWITRKVEPSSQSRTSGIALSSTPSTAKMSQDALKSWISR
ncbi:adhesion G protein-coupled receptor E1 [Thomomys bottae]